MSDYIKRKDVVELLNNSYVQEDGRHIWRDHNNDCIDRLIEKVKAMPVLSARPKGEWIKEHGVVNCSNCNHSHWSDCYEDTVVGFNFCPNCGADMRERKESE